MYHNRAPDLFCVTSSTRARGHCLLVLSAGTKTQSSGHNSHNHDRFYKFQSISPPFAAGCFGLFRQGTKVKQRFSQLFWMGQYWANSRFNDDRRPIIDQIEQFNYIGAAHPNAAMARWAADLVLVFCAVNVDEAVARVGIVLFQSIEPQDARHHQVLGRRKRIAGLEWDAALKNGSARQIAPNFFDHAKISSGCLVAPLLRPNAESRSGHRIAADWLLAFLQGEPLISNRDVYVS